MKKILVVDDEEINRIFLVDLLKMHKINAGEAVNGQDAIDKWVNGDYSAILMDIQMPVLDGYEATRQIRHLENDKGLLHTPIIAVSAYRTSEAKDQCHEAGIDAFLPKPVVISDLLNVVLPLTRAI